MIAERMPPPLVQRLLARRALALDLALFVAAAVLPFHPVYDWLDGHRVLLYWAVGSVHVVYIPLMMIQQIGGSSRSGKVLLSNEESPRTTLMSYVSVLFFVASFVVPVCFSMGVVSSSDLNGAAMAGFLFGPYVLLVAGFAMVLRLEKRIGYHRVTALFESASLELATVLLTWAYLTLTETTLFVAASSRGVWSGGLALGAAFVSYLPVRLYVFFFRSTDRAELALLLVTFGHLLFRLALAGH
jgi:hypothetical protein